MDRPITDGINAAPLCFQKNVELNAYNEETADKKKLSKAASKVLGSTADVLTLTTWPFHHLWLEGLFFWWAPVLRRSAQRSTGCCKERIFIFIRRLIKSSNGGLGGLSGKRQKPCALGCIVTGIVHRQVWVIRVISPTTWRVKMGADALSAAVSTLHSRGKKTKLNCSVFPSATTCAWVVCLKQEEEVSLLTAMSRVCPDAPASSRLTTKSLALLQPPPEAFKAAAVNGSRQAWQPAASTYRRAGGDDAFRNLILLLHKGLKNGDDGSLSRLFWLWIPSLEFLLIMHESIHASPSVFGTWHYCWSFGCFSALEHFSFLVVVVLGGKSSTPVNTRK